MPTCRSIPNLTLYAGVMLLGGTEILNMPGGTQNQTLIRLLKGSLGLTPT